MSSQKREETAEKMLDAAKQLVHDKGYEAITVREIAKLTGYTYPLLYHYYHDLEGFLWKLRLSMIDDMIQQLAVPSDERDAPIEALRNAFSRYMMYFFDHPNVYRFFYFRDFKRPQANDEYADVERKLMELRMQYFARVFNVDEHFITRTQNVAKVIIYALHGIMTMAFSANGDMDRETAVCELNALIDFLLENNKVL